MKLTKVVIEKFKSIDYLEFDIRKYGNSYTTMLVGVNESGKSNILEAMNFFKIPEWNHNYHQWHNQKDMDGDPVDLRFFLEFGRKETYSKKVQEKINNGDILDFEIHNIVKNIYLEKDETTFSENIKFEFKKFPKWLFIKWVTGDWSPTAIMYELSKTKDDDIFEELTEELFKKYFEDLIIEIIKKHEPVVSFWKPSEEYLISEADLTAFAQNITINKPLKNIFSLAGYDDADKIKSAINNITNWQQRSILQSKLQDEINNYIQNVWKHKIDIIIDITETGKFTLSIKDKGEKNKHDRLPINARSEGAKHFLSLILSLSIENAQGNRSNQLILIDEPEIHLHPSGIRDIREELLNIGKNNYVFVSTHSPFLIDKNKKERNIIIKKNDSAFTEKREIKDYENFIDDEVLREAFGIEVYKDLLNPHSILVEGASDKTIFQKAFNIKNEKNYGITNGHGSNIDTLASKLNDTGISILVIVDDDDDGKKYKEKIIKTGWSYSHNNVFTIRDLVGDIIDWGTIEDALGKTFMESKFKEFSKENLGKECTIALDETKPFIPQIKAILHQNFTDKTAEKKDFDKIIEDFKFKISEGFNPTKSGFKKGFPLLESLIEKISIKLEKKEE